MSLLDGQHWKERPPRFLEALAFDRDGEEQTEYFDEKDQQTLDKAVREFLETLTANELLTLRRARHGDFDSFVAPMLKRAYPGVISPSIFSAQPLLTSPPSSHGVIFAEEDKG